MTPCEKVAELESTGVSVLSENIDKLLGQEDPVDYVHDWASADAVFGSAQRAKGLARLLRLPID
jgi:hypothetical protein